MKLNSTRRAPSGCTPPPVPAGLCGPEALAELLIESRKCQPDWAGPISADGVRKLVKLIFFASLIPEEGRYTRYKLVCEQAEGSFFLITQIDPLALDEVNQIRRLAPACNQPDCALLVAERDGTLYCTGVIATGSHGFATPPGYPGIIGVGRPFGLRFEVFGPGHLRASETCYGGYEMRAGCIRPLSHYSDPEPIPTLLSTLQARVCRDVCNRLGERAIRYDWRLKGWPSSLHLLSKLLRTAADARHGAAFVFLPGAGRDPFEYGLEILYRTTSLDLGADLAETWIAYLESLQQRDPTERNHDAVFRSARFRARLLTNVEAVGHFSCVDGCVVLTDEFKVLGFGAKIDAPVSRVEELGRRFKHLASGEIYDNSTFMSAIGGTRHQSAARLCQIHPRVLVFALSQDGDLKMFTSDDKFAYAYGPLDLPTIDDQDSV